MFHRAHFCRLLDFDTTVTQNQYKWALNVHAILYKSKRILIWQLGHSAFSCLPREPLCQIEQKNILLALNTDSLEAFCGAKWLEKLYTITWCWAWYQVAQLIFWLVLEFFFYLYIKRWRTEQVGTVKPGIISYLLYGCVELEQNSIVKSWAAHSYAAVLWKKLRYRSPRLSTHLAVLIVFLQEMAEVRRSAHNHHRERGLDRPFHIPGHILLWS